LTIELLLVGYHRKIVETSVSVSQSDAREQMKMEIFGFVLWIVFAYLVGALAANRRRNGFGWFFLSLVISPLLGLLFLLVLPERGMRTCPFCAEQVKSEATVCRYCGRDLPADKEDR
jgi:hypothetical protein